MMFSTTSSFPPHFYLLFAVFTEKHYLVVTNFLGATYNHNPHLSAFSVALPGPDMDDSLEGLEEQLPDKVGKRQNYGAVAADGALNIHSGKGKKSQHYNTRMVEKEDMHRTSTVYVQPHH